MGSAREGTVEHRPSLLKCHYDCLFVLRKELKFILATHTDGRVWTRRVAPAYNRVGRGGAVRPSRPIAKSATATASARHWVCHSGITSLLIFARLFSLPLFPRLPSSRLKP